MRNYWELVGWPGINNKIHYTRECEELQNVLYARPWQNVFIYELFIFFYTHSASWHLTTKENALKGSNSFCKLIYMGRGHRNASEELFPSYWFYCITTTHSKILLFPVRYWLNNPLFSIVHYWHFCQNCLCS